MPKPKILARAEDLAESSYSEGRVEKVCLEE